MLENCLVQCVACGNQWVKSDELVCDDCLPKINIDVACVELHDHITYLQGCPKSDLIERKDLLKTASKKLFELIRRLEEK